MRGVTPRSRLASATSPPSPDCRSSAWRRWAEDRVRPPFRTFLASAARRLYLRLVSEATNMRARPATQVALRSGVALILAFLVLLGLASSGLALPERADTRPLVPHDFQQASASGRASSGPAVEVSARRTVVAATSLASVAAVAPISTRYDLAHQDADVRRSRLRLRIEIRGPPAGRFA